jgi:peptide/nickel transport system permease protein
MNIRKIINITRTGKLGLAILLIFAILAVFAPVIAPHDPFTPGKPFLPPGPEHLLGTNDIGQDIFSELLYGARISLLIGFLAAFISLVMGTLVGIAAGYRGGFTDEALMSLTDVMLTIPGLPLLIILAAYLKPGFWNIMLIIGLLWWAGTARVVRAQVLTIREAGYVEVSRIMGAKDRWVMGKHILPNVMPIVLAKFILTVAGAMLTEASLSFLGLGDPVTKSWGMMLPFAFSRGGFLNGLWWWYLPPGLCIALCVLGFTLLSFSFEEKTDPRLRRILER